MRAVVAEVLQVPAISGDLAMADAPAWDSLKHMELVITLERAFGLAFDFDEIVAMRSVGDIVRVLAARGAAG